MQGKRGLFLTLGLAWGSSIGVATGVLLLPRVGLPSGWGIAVGLVTGVTAGLAIGFFLGRREV